MALRRNVVGLLFVLALSLLSSTQWRFSIRPFSILFPAWDDGSLLSQSTSTTTSKIPQYDDNEDANVTSPIIQSTSSTPTSGESNTNHSIPEQSPPPVRHANITCPPGLELAKSSTISFPNDQNWRTAMIDTNTLSSHYHHHRHHPIPPAVHMISKTKCLTGPFRRNLDRWRFVNHTLHLHDDMDANLLFAMNNYWKDVVPDFEHAIRCLPNHGASSASKSDLWRYVLLWQQGGIYTDLDNRPSKHFMAGLISLETDLEKKENAKRGGMDHGINDYDAILVLRHDKENPHNIMKPAQSFLLTSMHHPLMYLCWKLAVASLMDVPDLALQRAYAITGPRILEQALAMFLGLDNDDDDDEKEDHSMTTLVDKVRPGTFPISHRVFDHDPVAKRLLPLFQNRTVTLLSNGIDRARYIETSTGIRRAEKLKFYRLAGMTVWQEGGGDDRHGISCRDFVTRNTSTDMSNHTG